MATAHSTAGSRSSPARRRASARSTARHLATCGATVVLADLDEGRAQAGRRGELADGLAACRRGRRHRRPRPVPPRSSTPPSRARPTRHPRQQRRDLPGRPRSTPAEEIPVDVWRRIVDVNVNGMYFMCRAVIPHMKASGSRRDRQPDVGLDLRGAPGHGPLRHDQGRGDPAHPGARPRARPARCPGQRDRPGPHRHPRDARGHLRRR